METLREKKTQLAEILAADSGLILNYVDEYKLITMREYNILRTDKSSSDWHTVVNLLDKLMNKDEITCNKFIDLLHNPKIVIEYPDLKEVFKQNNNPSPRDRSSGPIPCTGVSVLEASVPGGDEVGLYDMSSIPRGLCFIINNDNFECHNKRDGTDKDASDLAKVFNQLKFTVLMCKDMKAAEIQNVLKLFSQLRQLSDLQPFDVQEWTGGRFDKLKNLPKHGDAFVCCILSHGNKQGVLGTDGVVVHNIDILSPFTNRNCSMLLEKPKLFFIQACRGKDKQEGVPVNKKRKVEEMDKLTATDDGSDQEYTVPEHSDFLIVRSNVEQYVSFRQSINGSWFIQCLCSQLEKSCTRGNNIHEILTAVNAEVSKQEAHSKVHNKVFKQSPEVTSTLTKNLIFPANP
ncbi:hypothetical protein DPEC_G00061330 [Dallia pectoralis]|uniref:Uncharacterized protein n=1 Tax=Dallia pectoralis TaxID=75939 RepID=A0ACC2H700_DALPE|nr:hypothetical protein DPEC_G00061330 [Dallia pectoralis]